MNKSTTLLAGALCSAALSAGAFAAGVPQIQFDQTLYDFGKTSQVATVAGVFKFKNTGESTLVLEAPKPSCGCTVAELKPNILAPGATGELAFTLNLGLYRATLEKRIAVVSNDPKTPEVSLVIKVDYTPLYEISPMTLAPSLAFGTNDTTEFATLTRTDGKPLRILRLDSSKPWITATMEPGAKPGDASGRVRVDIHRDGAPRRFNEYVHVYSADQTNTPVSALYLYGQIMGEVSMSPEALYWTVPSAGNLPAERPESLVLRRVTVRSADGKAIQLKNPQSTIKGIQVELVPKDDGKLYELVARLADVPAATLSGKVSFETSVAAQPVIELPVIVNVSKP